ncbi:E3 ubiquitin-protein ligase RNF13 isoform X2 [Pleurodeles waltl]|uniref:E3 ubiquitin-protein ligase RNF13 isoform X2 n=1 Tax=Pleurodeles waltl TaxID=8319 RepID=UPI003709854A
MLLLKVISVPSTNQFNTVITIQLLAFFSLLPVKADIKAYSLENVTQTFDDMPARFGYSLPSNGLKGFLVVSKPENACEPIAPPPMPKENVASTFIILIRRLDCNFDIKVLNAQKAGYKAAVVYNVDSDDLISMGSNDIELMKKIDIPSVFIGEASANSLKDEFTYERGGHIVLLPEWSLPLEYYLIPFLIIVGICLILIVIFMITKFVQDRHKSRKNRLRKDQLKKLPVHKYKKAYHCRCVDPWLTKTKKTCPVCKQKVVPSQEDSDTDSDSSQEDEAVTEHTPLIRPLTSISTQSFGAMSDSHQNIADSSEYEDDDNQDTNSSDEDEINEEDGLVVQLQQNTHLVSDGRNIV